MRIIDPIQFQRLCWPHISFYKEQKEIIYSVRDNPETIVPAGNALGKDFVTAFIALWFFWSRTPAKVVTTSPQAGQLEDVLWGEIRTFLDNSEYRLNLAYNHLKIRKQRKNGKLHANSELVGRVVSQGESLLGRHVPWGTEAGTDKQNVPMTMLIVDEASGMADYSYETADTWTHRKLIIGNCYPCKNFFYRGVKRGDVKHPVSTFPGLKTKVIKIRADQSPNVKLAEVEIAQGREPSHRTVVPGVVTYSDFLLRKDSWDEQRKSIGLYAEFYEGEELKLYPASILLKSEEIAQQLEASGHARIAKAIGCDPAEGGDNTSWSVIDELGLIELLSLPTPNTADITSQTIALMNQYNVPAEKVCFDRGGGGKQHADRLREQGYNVATVGFGEAVTLPPKSGMTPTKVRKEQLEQKYVFKNRRAQMYGEFSLQLETGFGISVSALDKKVPGTDRATLRQQMTPIPKQYDPEGRLKLPPKSKKNLKSPEITLIELIGNSPDELESLVMADYIRRHGKTAFRLQAY